MKSEDPKAQHVLEIFLTLIAVGLTVMLYLAVGHKITVLNLFYLPVILAGFFLGRYRAGILAFFCVISASAVIVLDLNNFATFTSPVAAILAVMIWSAVFGIGGPVSRHAQRRANGQDNRSPRGARRRGRCTEPLSAKCKSQATKASDSYFAVK